MLAEGNVNASGQFFLYLQDNEYLIIEFELFDDVSYFPEWPSTWRERHPRSLSKFSGMLVLLREGTHFSREKLLVPLDPR